jgi:hypothetical protein
VNKLIFSVKLHELVNGVTKVIGQTFKSVMGAALMLALIAMAPRQADATTIFNSLSAWTAAVGGNVQGVDLSGPTAFIDSNGNVSGGLVSTITIPTGVVLTLDPTKGFHRDFTDCTILCPWNGTQEIFAIESLTQDSLTITLSANLPAFGLEMETGDEPFDMSVILSDGTVINSNGLVSGPQFFGWTGAVGLTSITLQCGDPATDGDACANPDPFDNDNANGFAFANLVVPVPEPASLTLFGAGLLGLAAWRRRRAA